MTFLSNHSILDDSLLVKPRVRLFRRVLQMQLAQLSEGDLHRLNDYLEGQCSKMQEILDKVDAIVKLMAWNV